MTDIANQYRHHAAMVADGERRRPNRALLIEFDAIGVPTLMQFGPAYGSNREAIACLLDAVGILNADAAN